MLINLLPPKLRQVDVVPWQRVYAAGALTILGSLVAIYLYGYYEISALEAQLQKDRATYQLLMPTIERRAALETVNAKLERQYSVLTQLSKMGRSSHALLVHLGMMTTKNVWLTAVKFDNQQDLIMEGCASGYKELALFIQRFENDSLLGNLVLVSAGSSTDSGKLDVIKFKITAKFKEF